MLYTLIICYSIAFILLMFSCYWQPFKKYHVLCKCAASMFFLVTAIYGGIKNPGGNVFWELFPALLFCFLGDYFLAKKSENKAKKNFMCGLLSFLIGHCLFLVGLSFYEPSNVYVFLLPFAGVLLTFGLLHLKKMVVGSFKRPVLMYAYFVSALFFKCAQIFLHGDGSLFYFLILAGGALFMVSDIIILFLYFYQTRYGIIKFLNLFTYYAATFLLALSILFH